MLIRAGTSPGRGLARRGSVNTASVDSSPHGCRVFCLFFSGKKVSVRLIQSRMDQGVRISFQTVKK